ncbi:hypothetical protein FS749_015628 [Ceratobasidium sp. UAMH 11750]|nr:hypothetical protein FS749_015628 [Ceratobasidium sp. UAMH 11750]
MSAKRPTPRLFLIRHGETEWSLNGRHTGRTDIPLTERGVSQVRTRAGKAVGPGKLIDPANVEYAFTSPRQRASTTFELLFADAPGGPPSHELTEECREWDYGEYEGLKPAEIQEVKPGFSIWRDGCPGGESPEQMTARIDGVVERVRTLHRRYLEEGVGKRDVIIVAHGHFSRVFITRWLRLDLMLGSYLNLCLLHLNLQGNFVGTRWMMEPAGVAVLTYQHKNIEEPSLFGLNFFTEFE